MTLNNLDTRKIKNFGIFLQFRATTHILRVNCPEMAGDRLRQPAHKFFVMKRRF